MKTWLMFTSLTMVLFSGFVQARAPEFRCTIQTYNGRYLTAVGGGGRLTDVLHTDARVPRNWERFVLEDTEEGRTTGIVRYGIRTYRGNYLTAVGGGGRTTDVIHSDATWLRDWEKFKFNSLGFNWYSIQTISGHYLTAVGGGGRVTDVIHSDATVVGNWEKFKVNCSSPIEE